MVQHVSLESHTRNGSMRVAVRRCAVSARRCVEPAVSAHCGRAVAHEAVS